jgi:hypothetical protein
MNICEKPDSWAGMPVFGFNQQSLRKRSINGPGMLYWDETGALFAICKERACFGN